MNHAGTTVTDSEKKKLMGAVAGFLDLPPSEIDLDTPLHETGRVDSLAIVSLVAFVEDELGVKLPVDQIVPANFASVRQVLGLVTTARSAAAAPDLP